MSAVNLMNARELLRVHADRTRDFEPGGRRFAVRRSAEQPLTRCKEMPRVRFDLGADERRPAGSLHPGERVSRLWRHY